MQGFYVNDIVSFEFRAGTLRGTIARLNPKRARVVCDDGDEYNVPYELLIRHEGSPAATYRDTTEVASLAEQLMDLYGLEGWAFEFDNARRRSGACHFGRRTISMALEFARVAPDNEIDDTIRHEIAHALVGPDQGHGPVWQAKAREIGCSAKRCHEVEFSQPLYIVRCRNGCFTQTANRRRRKVVCRTCGGSVDYSTYIEERWELVNAPVREGRNPPASC